MRVKADMKMLEAELKLELQVAATYPFRVHVEKFFKESCNDYLVMELCKYDFETSLKKPNKLPESVRKYIYVGNFFN
jgi:hypothetical protein